MVRFACQWLEAEYSFRADDPAEAVEQHSINNATAFGQLAHSLGPAQSLREWLVSLGGGCESFAPALEKMGYHSVFDIVEAR